MNPELRDIPGRILRLARAALTQANQHAVFMDPGSEHWPLMSVLNTAHAGELFLKAIIASEHPLLIFKDLVTLDDKGADSTSSGCSPMGRPMTSTNCRRCFGRRPASGFPVLTATSVFA